MTLIPYSEYRPDVADYQSPYSAFVSNVLARGDGYGPFSDFSTYSAALAGPCRGFFRALKTDGSVSIFAATSTKLYNLNNATLAWTDVSKAGGSYSAIPSTDQWQFWQFNNFVKATQANTVQQLFDLTSSTAFIDTLGSPPLSRYGSVVGRFEVLSGLVGNPYNVAWSGLNDVNSANAYTPGINSSDVQPLPDGGILRGVGGGEFGNIYQDTAVRRMTFMPGSAAVFQIQRISEDVGMYSAGSLIKAGGRQFFFSTAGFQMIDATGALSPIGKERVDRTFLTDLDKGNLQLFIGASDPRSSRVFWAYKSNSGNAGLFDKIICYDWALDRWAPIAMSGEYLGSLAQPGMTLEGLDTISTSIDALTASLDSWALSGTPEIAAFNSSNVLGFFRGPSLEAKLDTPEQSGDGRSLFVRGFRPITDAPGAVGSIVYRAKQSDNATVSAEKAVDSYGKVNIRRTARFVRGRVRIPAGTVWTFAKGIEPDVTLTGSNR
ncbi:MAG TPA: hypothetical protein VK620_12165 [Bradyrhizobium sp.]|nr:hypothetical protein [Bradyrhizobium sp.]